MGKRSLTNQLALAASLATACVAAPIAPPRPPPPPPTTTTTAAAAPATSTPEEHVVAEFEAAVKRNHEAYVGLFDFHAVGELEILLHRYDLLGRLKNLPDDVRAQFAAEDGTPYPADRERTSVGRFYDILAQRTVGSGGCRPRPPRTRYAKKLGQYEPLPAGTPETYEALRIKANGYVAGGGVVAFSCSGGKGGIVVVWTKRANPRGFDLVTIYDD